MSPPETLVVKGGTTWARNGRWILPENARLPRNIQGSLHSVNLHGTNGFTSLPKEDVLRNFLPWKIRRFRPGLSPWTLVPKASTLPLDHRSRWHTPIIFNDYFFPTVTVVMRTRLSATFVCTLRKTWSLLEPRVRPPVFGFTCRCLWTSCKRGSSNSRLGYTYSKSLRWMKASHPWALSVGKIVR